MKSLLGRLGVVLIGLIILGYGCPLANAQSTLALQEKCAEGAKKFFLERINFYGGSWGSFNNEKGWGWNDFTSHYNTIIKNLINVSYLLRTSTVQKIKRRTTQCFIL